MEIVQTNAADAIRGIREHPLKNPVGSGWQQVWMMPSKQRQHTRKVFCLGLWQKLQGQNLIIKKQNSSQKFPTMQQMKS